MTCIKDQIKMYPNVIFLSINKISDPRRILNQLIPVKTLIELLRLHMKIISNDPK